MTFNTDTETGRFVCTWDAPRPKDAPGRWIHPEAKAVSSGSDYFDRYHCQNCGLTFTVELPE